VVQNTLAHLKSLRKKDDPASLYQAIVLGGAFIEGLRLPWFQKALAQQKIGFYWKENFPYIEMRRMLALLNSINLVNDNEYKKFQRATEYRNRVVHYMYSQWATPKAELEKMADLIIECVATILSGLKA